MAFFLSLLDIAMAADNGPSINLDNFSSDEMELPDRADPPISLSDLRNVLDDPMLLLLDMEVNRLNDKDYRFVDGTLSHAVRVTVDRDFYEMDADSVEFWTPGNPTFPYLSPFQTAIDHQLVNPTPMKFDDDKTNN